MIEIKNVVKRYRTKKGVVVNALNGVSIKLADTGMVFLLGKSGSGKSTLLNVLGGLDSIDSGEIIFRGKSAKDFKQSHYDSYRNTYVGFIFQEYNVLEELTVGANIALAIELQGRKATNEEINAILAEVDLEGYGARKPNELSGGQKQRVAIARALVKNPEVIMADEPSGALDSVTGKQVFESLKKLSRDRLVLVVSHDREFAETYADRIIELSDGEVISDTERKYEDSKPESEDVAGEPLRYEGETVYIEKGYELTEEDRLAINEYLRALSEGVALRVGERIEKRENERIFLPTDESKIESSDKGDFKLIKSKLSLKNAFKLGSGGLKYKKFKLVFTIFLSLISFTLFGLADTIAAYDSVTTATESLMDSDIDYASFAKGYKVYYGEGKNDYYIESYYAYLSDAEMEALSLKVGKDLIGVYNRGLNLSFYSSLFGSKTEGLSPDRLYPSSFSGIAPITASLMGEHGFSFMGTRSRLPAGKGEIVITDYIYDYISIMGLSKPNEETGKIEKIEISTPDELIGKSISFGLDSYAWQEYKIVGIIDTGFDYSRYEPLMHDDQMNNMNFIVAMALQSELVAAQEYSYYATAFVSEELFAYTVENSKNNLQDFYASINIYSLADGDKEWWEDGNTLWGLYIGSMEKLDGTDGAIVWKDEPISALSDNQVILSTGELIRLLASNFSEKATPAAFLNAASLTAKLADGTDAPLLEISALSRIGDFVYYIERISALSYAKEHIDELRAYMEHSGGDADMCEYDLVNAYANSWNVLDGKESFTPDGIDVIGRHSAELIFKLFSELAADGDEIVMDASSNFYPSTITTRDVEIVGVYYSEEDVAVVSDSLYASLIGSFMDGVYAYAVGEMPDGYYEIKNIVKFTKEYEEDGVVFLLKNSVTEELSFIDELLVVLGQVFLYVGIGFAVFASLMLANFIGTSISYKKQEIGILRAIGSRSADVFRIFFAESFIIAMINYVLSLLSTGCLVFFINKLLREDAGLLITILNFGIRQVVVLFLISLLVAFVATFLPVRKIASMKPIDAIKNRK